ncbi:MAG: hypothetical protein LBS89_00395 [Zoogloeaceae bacterium]|jgi:hypothetical protein|nr:hypothetical protein [Zoogloeaceae bacterium]
MSSLTAFALSPAWVPTAQCPQITTDLWTFDPAEIVGWPVYASISPDGGVTARLTHFPVAANGKSISAFALPCYAGDYYYRLHVLPQTVALGNISSTQSFAARVWNAWFVPRTLTALNGADNGIVVSGQPAPPLLFQPLEEKIYQIAATPDGTPVLDTRLTWTFDDGEAPGLRVTANRIIAWGWPPAWDDGVVERLEWATDILQSESLVEQRRALRLTPRRAFEADFVADGRERQMLDLMLFDWGARVWVLPLWAQAQTLADGTWAGETRIECATACREFHPGGLIVLKGATARDTEVLEVAAVDAGGVTLKRPVEREWPVGTRLFPACSAQLSSEPALARLSDAVMTLSAGFVVLDVSDASSTPPALTYRARPVFAARPDETETLTRSFARLLALLDSGLSTPRQTDIGEQAMPLLTYRWIGLGLEKEAELREMLYWLKGRQGAMWIPSHADDLTPVDVASASVPRWMWPGAAIRALAQRRPDAGYSRVLAQWHGVASPDYGRQRTGSGYRG